jgi:hypothetical protein
MTARVLCVLAAFAALGGCSSMPIFEGGRAWDEGWREGEVEKVGNAAELGYRHSYDCRYRSDGAGRQVEGRFAVVAVRNRGEHRHVVAPIEAGKEPQVGAPVLVNWRGCEPPIVRSGK